VVAQEQLREVVVVVVVVVAVVCKQAQHLSALPCLTQSL
jgi:hypothetical protein